MTTFYDDRTVRITSEVIRVNGRAYPLPTLARIWPEQGAPRWGALAGRGVLGVALIAPLVAAAIGLGIAFQINAAAPIRIAIIGGCLLVGLATAPLADLLFEQLDRSYARGTRELRLWAEFRGQPVLLLQTRDALRFGQIHRALRRALEQRQRVGSR
ncbi:MAG TPA: DUF6232 family protein [Micromonosporaceae bacterium]|nr:DUF6232 family protein [Micromonosporaceae bacterium]